MVWGRKNTHLRGKIFHFIICLKNNTLWVQNLWGAEKKNLGGIDPECSPLATGLVQPRAQRWWVGTVHARCCHWLATSAAFAAKITPRGASKRKRALQTIHDTPKRAKKRVQYISCNDAQRKVLFYQTIFSYRWSSQFGLLKYCERINIGR